MTLRKYADGFVEMWFTESGEYSIKKTDEDHGKEVIINSTPLPITITKLLFISPFAEVHVKNHQGNYRPEILIYRNTGIQEAGTDATRGYGMYRYPYGYGYQSGKYETGYYRYYFSFPTLSTYEHRLYFIYNIGVYISAIL